MNIGNPDSFDRVGCLGLRVIEVESLVTHKVVKIEKSRMLRWVESVLKWDPCNAELVTPDEQVVSVPADEVFISEDAVICHPAVARRIREARAAWPAAFTHPDSWA